MFTDFATVNSWNDHVFINSRNSVDIVSDSE